MSWPVVLLLSASAVQSEAAPRYLIQSAVRETPEDITEPNILYKCTAEKVEGKKLNFTVLYRGSRGYQNPKTNELLETKSSVDFSGPDGNLFDEYRISASSSLITGYSENTKVPFGQMMIIEFRETQFPYKATPPYRVGLLIQQERAPGIVHAVGFCNREFSEQKALGNQEVTDLMKSQAVQEGEGQ